MAFCNQNQANDREPASRGSGSSALLQSISSEGIGCWSHESGKGHNLPSNSVARFETRPAKERERRAPIPLFRDPLHVSAVRSTENCTPSHPVMLMLTIRGSPVQARQKNNPIPLAVCKGKARGERPLIGRRRRGMNGPQALL